MANTPSTVHHKEEKARQSPKAKTLRLGGIVTVTVGELRTSFKAVEANLAKGMRVQITRRGQVVAEMKAPAVEVQQTSPETSFVDYLPEMQARLRKIWGDKPLNIDTTAMVSEGRDRDFLS